MKRGIIRGLNVRSVFLFRNVCVTKAFYSQSSATVRLAVHARSYSESIDTRLDPTPWTAEKGGLKTTADLVNGNLCTRKVSGS